MAIQFLEHESPPPGRVKGPTEHHEQCRVITFLRRNKLWYHSIPNGAHTSAREKAKLKREGLVSGVPDLYILDSRVGGPLAVEMKRSGGNHKDVSRKQVAWLKHLNEDLGWEVFVSFGAQPILDLLKERLCKSPK